MAPTVQFGHSLQHCNGRIKPCSFAIASNEPSSQAIVSMYLDLCLSAQFRQQWRIQKVEGTVEAAVATGTLQYQKYSDGFLNQNPMIGALKLVDHQQGKVLP
jgi:hypothetical protein